MYNTSNPGVREALEQGFDTLFDELLEHGKEIIQTEEFGVELACESAVDTLDAANKINALNDEFAAEIGYHERRLTEIQQLRDSLTSAERYDNQEKLLMVESLFMSLIMRNVHELARIPDTAASGLIFEAVTATSLKKITTYARALHAIKSGLDAASWYPFGDSNCS
ncbi:MAG: hypothetical protein R3B69_04030 [Candidatus Paceibacterota bacterium]